MNTYFCEVGANLSKNIKQSSNFRVKPIVRNTKTLLIRPTNSVEICKIINDLKDFAIFANILSTLMNMKGTLREYSWKPG